MIIFDNINYKVYDDLKKEIKKGTKIAISAAYFSIYAYQKLKEELEKIDEFKFIYTSPTFTKENFIFLEYQEKKVYMELSLKLD